MLQYTYRFAWSDPKTRRSYARYLDAASKTAAEKDFEAHFGLKIEDDGVKVTRIKP